MTPPARRPTRTASSARRSRFANRVVALFSEDGPLVLELDRQSVEIRNIQISGGEGTLSVRGRATSRAVAETALVQIESSGRGPAPRRRCAPTPSWRTARAVGRRVHGLQHPQRGPRPGGGGARGGDDLRYRGKLLRALVARRRSRSRWAAADDVRLTPTRASATAGNLVVTGKAESSDRTPRPNLRRDARCCVVAGACSRGRGASSTCAPSRSRNATPRSGRSRRRVLAALGDGAD